MKNKILLGVAVILSLALIGILHNKKTNYYFPMQSAVEHDDEIITIRLLNESTNEISVVNLEDYIIGVVSAEMPASFELEALKAQAVAARTYAMYKKNTRNLDYDCIIGTKDQAYQTNEQLFKKWNVSFFQNYLKVRKSVLETKGEVIKYNGEIINAFYFSMSNGKTENSELVFHEALPYLNSVESKWDNISLSNFEVEKVLSRKEFCEKLEIKCDDIKINNIERTESNRVNKITINDKEFKGTNVRTILGLRSTDFDIIIDGDIKITTRGFGHGVGMSQYGANGMAKENYSYEQILNYFYQNTTISQIS